MRGDAMSWWNCSGIARVSWGLCLLLGALGCGGAADDGPPRYQLSGTVTYAGQPVPAGDINLVPDFEQNNAGPGTFCMIQNGKFSTPAGKGVVGGPYILTISGYRSTDTDAENNQLFDSYDYKIDLPQSNHTVTIEVPGK